MRSHYFAKHSETGVIHLASAETDAHAKMRPITLDEAEAAGFDVSRFRGKEVTATAPKKNQGGRPKKEKAPAALQPGQMLVTSDTAPAPEVAAGAAQQ